MGNMTKLDNYLKKVEERLNNATEGPWELDSGVCVSTVNKIVIEEVPEKIKVGVREMPITTRGRLDGEFIAHARQDVEVLLKMVNELRHQRNAWKNAQINSSFRLNPGKESDVKSKFDLAHGIDTLKIESLIPGGEDG
jgi:hypothetical protein